MTEIGELPTLNRDLLVQVVTHMVDHPEQHDQGCYLAHDPECGTIGCSAGWIVAFSRWSEDSQAVLDFAPPTEGWTEAAQRLAGLTDREAQILFSCETTEPCAVDFIFTLLAGGRSS